MRKSNLGAIYLQMHHNQLSLRNYTQSLKLYSELASQNVDLSNIYHNVGVIYLREKMYEIASKYFRMAIEERNLKSPHLQIPLFTSVVKFGISLKM